jgi:hypothetical protein
VEGSATEIRQFHIPPSAPLMAGAVAVALGHAVAADNRVVIDVVHSLQSLGAKPGIVGELAIDTDPARRLVVPNKCEEAGEQELQLLARAANLEEAFAFVPDHCMWIEIGLDQTSLSVRIERAVIDSLVESFGRIVVYHVHSSAAGEAVGYLPGYTDLIGAVLINGRYLVDGGVEILHRAATPAGIFQYAFKPSEAGARLVELIFSSGLGRFAGENLLLSYAGPKHEREYHDAVRRCPALSMAEGAPPLGTCFPMRAGDFVLQYREPDGRDP